MRKACMTVGFSLLTALLCSCASVSVVDTWRNPAVSTPALKKVLVVSITKKDASRKIFEEMLAEELSRHGVEAVIGHTLIPEDGRGNWSVLEKAMKSSTAQAVLTVQTIKVERQVSIQPGYPTVYPGIWYPQAFPDWDLYGYYGSMALYGPTYISTYDIATMQVNLFDAASGKLLWAATLQSSEPEKVISVGKDLARKVVEALVKQGLI